MQTILNPRIKETSFPGFTLAMVLAELPSMIGYFYRNGKTLSGWHEFDLIGHQELVILRAILRFPDMTPAVRDKTKQIRRMP